MTPSAVSENAQRQAKYSVEPIHTRAVVAYLEQFLAALTIPPIRSTSPAEIEAIIHQRHPQNAPPPMASKISSLGPKKDLATITVYFYACLPQQNFQSSCKTVDLLAFLKLKDLTYPQHHS